MAWCARILSEEPSKAEKVLDFAKELGNNIEVEIARAFICSRKGDKVQALCQKYGLNPIKLGTTSTEPKFIITDNGQTIINERVEALAERWLNGLREKLT